MTITHTKLGPVHAPEFCRECGGKVEVEATDDGMSPSRRWVQWHCPECGAGGTCERYEPGDDE